MATETVIDRLVTELIFRDEQGSRALDNFDKKIRATRDGLNRLGNATIAAGTALTAAATASVGAFSKYETNVAKLEALVGLTQQQTAEQEVAMERLGRQYGRTAGVVSDAMYDISSAQFEGEAAADVLEQSLLGSVAQLGTVKEVAQLVTDAIGAYGRENMTAANAVDTVTEAARLGKAAPVAMGRALGPVIGFLAEMGVGLEEGAGLIAQFSKAGVPLSQTANDLRATLSLILKPTTQALEVLEEYGLTIEGVRQSVRDSGLHQTLISLSNAFAGDADAMSTFFSSQEAIRFVLPLVGGQMEDTAALLADMETNAGAAAAAAERMGETLEEQRKRAMADFNWDLVQQGRRLKDTASEYIAFARDVLAYLRDLNPEVQRWIDLALQMGPVVIGAGFAFRFLGAALVPFWAFLSAGGGVGALLIALGVAAYLVWKHWDSIVATFRDAVEGIKEQWLDLLQFFKGGDASLEARVKTAEADAARFDRLADRYESLGRPEFVVAGARADAARAREAAARLRERIGQAPDTGPSYGYSLEPGFAGLTTPLPVGPAPSQAPGGGGGAQTVQQSVEIGKVEITAAGVTAEEVYRDAGRQLERELANAFEGLDSPIAR